MSEPAKVGQVWRHVGFEGVEATHLRVRIVAKEAGGWLCTYPDWPESCHVRYAFRAFERAYAPVAEDGDRES